MAELADALDLESSEATRAGSSPVPGRMVGNKAFWRIESLIFVALAK